MGVLLATVTPKANKVIMILTILIAVIINFIAFLHLFYLLPCQQNYLMKNRKTLKFSSL